MGQKCGRTNSRRLLSGIITDSDTADSKVRALSGIRVQRPRYVIATHYDDVVPRFLHFYRTSVACLLRIQTGLLQHISIATRDICITQYGQFEHLTDIRLQLS